MRKKKKKDIIVRSCNFITNELDNTHALAKKDFSNDFPNWYASVSFGKSRSKNYVQAIALAKMAPKYIENDVEGSIKLFILKNAKII